MHGHAFSYFFARLKLYIIKSFKIAEEERLAITRTLLLTVLRHSLDNLPKRWSGGLAILGLKINGVSKFVGFKGTFLVCEGLNFPGAGDLEEEKALFWHWIVPIFKITCMLRRRVI